MFSLLLVGGCAVTSDYETPDSDLPQELPITKAMDVERKIDYRNWWAKFEDPRLNRLLARAFQDNPDIRLQAARVQEARARLGFARAELFPTVDAQAEASRERQPGGTTGIPGAGATTFNLFSLAGVLNYELDIWGRLARERESAEALLMHNEFAQVAVRLSVIADVVTTYFSLSAARNELEITRETLDSREQTYELEKIRYDAGEINELILRQAESQLEEIRSQIPYQIRQVKQLEGALGILVGLSPAELFDNSETGSTSIESIRNPDVLPEVLPSELLARRPDIRAADAFLEAAGARIGAAKAARLPRLNLSAFLGSSALEVEDLFTSPAQTWGIGADVYGSLLDFGRNRANVESAEAIYLQSEIEYEATVKEVFNEVRNALVFYESAVNRERAVRRQLAVADRTLNLSEKRYREGLVGFIDFLDAQRAHFAARQAMNNAVRDRLSATATLFKALGGGWDADAYRQKED